MTLIQKYKLIIQLLKSDKFIVILLNPEEGVNAEYTNNLSNSELFNIYRKYRKKYFKLR